MAKEQPEIIHTYTEYQGDRAERMDRVYQRINAIHTFMKEHPNRYVMVNTIRPNGEVFSMQYHPNHLLFGLYDAAWSLADDLARPLKKKDGQWVKEYDPFGDDLANDIRLANRPPQDPS